MKKNRKHLMILQGTNLARKSTKQKEHHNRHNNRVKGELRIQVIKKIKFVKMMN